MDDVGYCMIDVEINIFIFKVTFKVHFVYSGFSHVNFLNDLLALLWAHAQTCFYDRLNIWELWTAAFLFFCAVYDFYSQGKNHFFIYLFCQSVAFFLVSLGYCGTFVPS
jgi:hypothetical protein